MFLRLFLFITIFAMLSSCITVPGAKDQHWGYFEEWDINRDIKVDANEFLHGYVDHDFFKKWAGRKSEISTAIMTSRLAEDGNKLTEALISSRDLNSTASAQGDSVDQTSGDQTNDALPAIINEVDKNNDQSISREEWAQEMFRLADENNDGSLTPIEFYLWQVLRP
jgi:hypothetical protein